MQEETLSRPRPDWLPIAPIRRIIEEYIAKEEMSLFLPAYRGAGARRKANGDGDSDGVGVLTLRISAELPEMAFTQVTRRLYAWRYENNWIPVESAEAVLRACDAEHRVNIDDDLIAAFDDLSSPRRPGQPSRLRKTSSRKRLYPWEVWLNGEEHELVQGKDFQTSPRHLSQQVRQVAERRGVKVSAFIRDDKVLIKPHAA